MFETRSPAKVLTSEESSDESFSDTESSDNGPESILNGERTVEQQKAMDNLIPALEPSEYGKMPPCFYDNSQRVAVDVMPRPATSNEGTKLKMEPIRPPILPRDKYDGVDSDDETDSEDVDSEEEERPQVIGEIEIDMQQEEDDFIEFSRQALGISDAQWAEIVKDRKEKGGM